MDALRNRRPAARGPLTLTTAAVALASAAGAAAQLVCEGGGNAIGISIDGSASVDPGPFGMVIQQVEEFIEDTSGFSTGDVNGNLYYVNTWAQFLEDTTGSFETNAGGAVSAAVDVLPFPDGDFTNIALGLQDLEEQFAALPADSGAPIAILFTDGEPNMGDTLAAADALKALDVIVAVVGFGPSISMETLEMIASERADGSELVFTTNQIGEIGDLLEEIITDIDTDGDGTPDCVDGCPEDPDKVDPGECGCGEPETCNDKKGKKGGRGFGRRHDKKKFEDKVDKRFKKFNKDFDDDFEKGGRHGHGAW